ncbi:hypothetical protein [Deinococcus sp. QL22]|uniref:hypothetical protein n=1 Tax=Deinococcus sp. QL22 TaxID=2939437 RepID=UPI0020181510|nr:hypothetical protein [Deinococcus sp. QL22]UQN09553.1 hypothetical protein M1R55_25740 [Deinococcus sp. QL22]
MKKLFHLPLLTSLPLLLTACAGSDDRIDLNGYQRKSFNTEAECRAYYRVQIERGLTYPCERSGSGARFIYFGPYFLGGFTNTTYLGYRRTGGVNSSGLQFKNGTYVGSYTAPSVSRGGFTSGSRSGGSFGG